MMQKIPQALIIAAIVTGFALSVRQIRLPGPQYDEMLHAPPAVTLVNGYDRRQGIGLMIGRKFFPFMTSEYVGALRTYLLLPAFFLLGPGVVAHRLTTILLMIVGLLFTAALARRALGDRAAVMGVWLIATDPTLILVTRNDWGPAAAGFMLRMGAFYFAWRWWESKGSDNAMPAAAALMLGLGVYDKAHFLWVVFALLGLGAMAWVWARLGGAEFPRLSKRQAGLALAGFIIGASPLLIFNLTHDWATFRSVSLPGEQVSLELLASRVEDRRRAFNAMFDTGAVFHWMTGERLEPHFKQTISLLLPLTLASLAVLLFTAFRKRRPLLLAMPALAAMLIAQMFLTPRPIWIHHTIVLYPLPHLMVGLAGALLWSAAGRVKLKWAAGAIPIAAVCLAVTLNLMTMAQFHRALAQGRGNTGWTDAVYALSEKLQSEYADRRIQLLDWGIYNQLELITAGKLDLREPTYEIDSASDPAQILSRLAEDRKNLFILHAPEAANFKQMEPRLELAVRQSGLVALPEIPVRDRRGRIIYRLCEFIRPAER